MKKSHGTKAAIAGAAAAIAIVLSASAALAAPVLQPGVTSAPGMSGTCTNCHTYAKPASTPTVVKPVVRSTIVSRPFIAKRKHKVGVNFSAWGYVAPSLPNVNNATVRVTFQRKTGAGSWIATSGLTATGKVTATGHFAGKTNYRARGINITQPSNYRMHVKVVWTDAKGVKHTKWSKRLYFRVYK